MSEPSAKPLHCIFYSHPWTALQLEQLPSINFADSVLLELSTQAILSQVLQVNAPKTDVLAVVLSDHQPEKTGLMKLFAGKKDFFTTAAHKNTAFPAPIILAPQPPVSVIKEQAAIQVLLSQPSMVEQLVILIHYQEAQTFADLYDYVDKFHIIWDIADLPCVKLTGLAELLHAQQLNSERWGGFHLCNHPKRPVSDQEERQAFFDALMDDYRLRITA